MRAKIKGQLVRFACVFVSSQTFVADSAANNTPRSRLFRRTRRVLASALQATSPRAWSLYWIWLDTELQAVSSDSFVYEYVGEIVGERAFQKRMKDYADEGLQHFYFMQLQKDEVGSHV